MKQGELNSAECYESSETADRNNQGIADALDLVIRELSQASFLFSMNHTRCRYGTTSSTSGRWPPGLRLPAIR